MVWPQLIYILLATVISSVFGPKPPRPKAAELEDFDVPVAEEDRPIPVIFGRITTSGPNVLWYGDLKVQAVRKHSLWSSSIVAYEYFMGLHFGLCHGPVDSLTKITIGDKLAWEGEVTESENDQEISNKKLFGGQKREGGVFGNFDVMMGEADQEPNEYLDAVVEANPAYRGVVTIVWKRGARNGEYQTVKGNRSAKNPMGYLGNTPYVKPWGFELTRLLKGWENDTVWNSTKLVIDDDKMNPAHIIYQCITNSEWGMSEPTSVIDETSFTAAADALFTEGFGLRLAWNRQSTIESFIGIILDHISADLNFNRRTGKYQLKLFRGDYDPDDLEEFNEDDVESVESFQRQLWGETCNEIKLTYTDPDTNKDAVIVVHDLANIEAQGARISKAIDYSGISDDDLAARVAIRELTTSSTPLSRIEFKINRRLWRYTRGDVFKFSWARLGLSNVIFRVIGIKNGTLRDGSISVQGLEDIYGLPASSYVVVQDPAEEPVVPDPPSDAEEDESLAVQSSALSTPPSTPSDGDRYYVPLTPPATGAWAGFEGTIVVWDALFGDEGAWIPFNIPVGQIVYDVATGQHVQTGVGGTLQPVPWTLPLTTKGDLLVHDGATLNRLPVGLNGRVLTTDSAAPLGVKWATPSGGGGGGGGAHYQLPLANGDPDDPEMVFSDGDVVTSVQETF